MKDDQPPKRTGLVCPLCQKATAIVVTTGETWVAFGCQACGHYWKATGPEIQKDEKKD